MNRVILFRGKCIDTGEWTYGDLLACASCTQIWQNSDFGKFPASVIPETVGQFTGLTDKNGKKVFEGDICRFYGGEYFSGFWEQNVIVAITDMTDDEQIHYLNNAEYCEVIGNIFDNPDRKQVR